MALSEKTEQIIVGFVGIGFLLSIYTGNTAMQTLTGGGLLTYLGNQIYQGTKNNSDSTVTYE